MQDDLSKAVFAREKIEKYPGRTDGEHNRAMRKRIEHLLAATLSSRTH